jgi:hypothetical protein
MNLRKTWYPVLSAIAAVLVCCGASAVELDGPTEVEVGQRFDVSVEGLTIPLTAFAKSAPPQMEWRVLCGEATIRPRLELRVDMVNGKPVWAASPYATVTASEPGAIAVVLFAVQDGVGHLAALEVAVGPFPHPQPTPEPGKRWVILIEETSERHLYPEVAALLVHSQFQRYLDANGHHLRAWDRDLAQADNAPLDAKGWIARAGDNLPRLFIASETGAILYEGPPPDASKAVALLQQHGG